MPVTLSKDELEQSLESAYLLAISRSELPQLWLARAEQLSESPSVAFIAAVGAVLLAKATRPEIDAMVIQAKEGSAGAFNLRAAATALARGKRRFGYDIGSSSDRDPINHGTLIGSTRWDLALGRIRQDHRPFFSLILGWLGEIDAMGQEEALEALAAYLRVRRSLLAAQRAEVAAVSLRAMPSLFELARVLEGFLRDDPEGGARGMALVVAAYRAAGFEAGARAPTDPRRIDVAVKRAGVTVLACEVKQAPTEERVAETLADEAAAAGLERALLAVLPPGSLVGLDRRKAVLAAEQRRGVVLRIAQGTLELLHEAFSAGAMSRDAFSRELPGRLAQALQEVAGRSGAAAWGQVAARWSSS